MAIWNGNILNDFENCRDRSRTALVLFVCAVSCLWCSFAQSCDWDSRYALQHYGLWQCISDVLTFTFVHCFVWMLDLGRLGGHCGLHMRLPKKQNWNIPNQTYISHQNFSVY